MYWWERDFEDCVIVHWRLLCCLWTFFSQPCWKEYLLGSEEACQEGKRESQARRGRKKGEGKGKVKLCEKQMDGTKIDGFK